MVCVRLTVCHVDMETGEPLGVVCDHMWCEGVSAISCHCVPPTGTILHTMDEVGAMHASG